MVTASVVVGAVVSIVVVVVEVDEVDAGAAAQADANVATTRETTSSLMFNFQCMMNETLPAVSTKQNIGPDALILGQNATNGCQPEPVETRFPNAVDDGKMTANSS
ncbi:MAG: hypothetical protein OEM81_04350, partial [Acidimicrobiia bacterium]|nr:hypothetical protein [Acidimicrobiia bacterium]